MQPGWEELTDEFDAVSADGREIHILVYTTIFDESSEPSQVAAPPVKLERICTSDGQNCTRIDDHAFEIVGLDLRVERE